MIDSTGKARYPLDEHLGLMPYKRYRPDVALTCAELAVQLGMTDRLAQVAIHQLTGISISHTTVAQIVKAVGKVQEAMDEEERVRIFERGETPETLAVPHLYGEADCLHVHGRGKTIERGA